MLGAFTNLINISSVRLLHFISFLKVFNGVKKNLSLDCRYCVCDVIDRYDERRDRFEEERFPAPAPVPPPADERGHRDYGPGRAPFEPPRGRPESYDREHDRYSREYGQPPDNRCR